MKFCGHQQLMMRWPKCALEMLQFGRCTKTHGIQFQESCQLELIQTTTWEYPSVSSSTKWTLASIRWWLKIKCTSLKTRDHSQVQRTLTAQKRCGDLKRTCWKKSKCGTQVGIQRTLTTTSTTKRTSLASQRRAQWENTARRNESI